MAGPLKLSSYKPEVVSNVSNSLRHYYKVSAYTIDGKRYTLDVLDVQLDYDEKRAPHISGRIRAAAPEDQETIDALDGRKGARIEIELGYILDDGAENIQIAADLMIGSVTLNYSANNASMELTGFSDELRLQEQLVVGEISELDMSGLVDFVSSVITSNQGDVEQWIAYDFPKDFGAGQLVGLNNEETSHVGTTAWDLIKEAMERTNTWVYCPMGRDWAIVNRPEVTDTPVLTLEAGENGNVINASRIVDRDEFYNVAILRYEWAEKGAVNAHKITGLAHISYGDFNVEKIGMKTYIENIPVKTTKALADAAAKSKLARLMSKAHKYDVTALALYSIRPGQTVRIKLFGEDIKLLVQQVTFSPESGLMDLILRKPERGEVI